MTTSISETTTGLVTQPKEVVVPFVHREAWLAAAAEHFNRDFEALGYPLPDRLRVTCG